MDYCKEYNSRHGRCIYCAYRLSFSGRCGQCENKSNFVDEFDLLLFTKIRAKEDAITEFDSSNEGISLKERMNKSFTEFNKFKEEYRKKLDSLFDAYNENKREYESHLNHYIDDKIKSSLKETIKE